MPVIEVPGARGLVVNLESSTLGEYHRSFLLKLDGGLVDRPDGIAARALESPRHQVPWLVYVG